MFTPLLGVVRQRRRRRKDVWLRDPSLTFEVCLVPFDACSGESDANSQDVDDSETMYIFSESKDLNSHEMSESGEREQSIRTTSQLREISIFDTQFERLTIFNT